MAVRHRVVVTELEANRLFARRSVSGPIVMHIKAELEPEGAKTRITWTIEAEAPGLLRLGEVVLRGVAKRQLKTTSARLRDRLHQGVLAA